MHDHYRPTTWEGVVGQETEAIRAEIDGGLTPNFLFHGPPGTGKTTVAKLIGDEIGDRDEILELNASDERGIEDVRELVPKAAQTTLSGAQRVVLLDEMEGLTIDAQQALRQPLEQSPSVFVLCTNDHDPGAGRQKPSLDAIHDALISRCSPYEFGPVPDRAVRQRIQQIADREGVDIGDNDLSTIVGFANGDMRAAIRRYTQVVRGAIKADDGDEGQAAYGGNDFERRARGFLEDE